MLQTAPTWVKWLELAGKLAEIVRPYAAPDFECLMAPLPPTPPVAYPGIEGIEQAWADFAESFRSMRADLEDVVVADGSLLMIVRQHAVTAHGGVEMSQPGALLVTVDAEHVTNVQFHIDPDAARRAGGISAPGPGPE